MLIQVKVGCFVVKEDDNLVVYRALDTNGCKGIVHEDKFLSSNCCRCPSHYERLIPLTHKLLKYCSKIYKEKNLITMSFGDTQKILNLVTDDELKSYETRYRKKVNILDDSKEHKPPTLVEKQPDQFNFTLSDSGEDGHFIDEVSVMSINKEEEKDLKKNELKTKSANIKRRTQSSPSNRGRGRGGRGRGRGGRDYMRGGRGWGRGGRGNRGGRYPNIFYQNNYRNENNRNHPNNHDDRSYAHPHSHSVAYSNGDRYHDDNYSINYDTGMTNKFDGRNTSLGYCHGYNKRKVITTDQSNTLSLDFNGIIKSVKLINANDLVKLNDNSFLKVGSKLIRLTTNENLFVEPQSGRMYVDTNALSTSNSEESNAIRVPNSVVSHVSTIGTNHSVTVPHNRKKAKVVSDIKTKAKRSLRKKSTLFKKLCNLGLISEKWKQPISILDKGNLSDPIRFFYGSCNCKSDQFKNDASTYTLDDIEWTFLIGNKERIFDSDVILECHSGKTPIMDIFSNNERKEFNSAKDALDKLEDMRCTKDKASM